MTKKLVLLMVLLMAVLLTACSGPVTASVDSTDVNPATLPATVDIKTVAAVKERDDVVLLDVREQWEYDEGHIPGVTLIPMNEVASRLSEIPTDKEVIVTCRSGNRSGQVADFLRAQGFDNVHNMQGGILAWEAAGLPVDR